MPFRTRNACLAVLMLAAGADLRAQGGGATRVRLLSAAGDAIEQGHAYVTIRGRGFARRFSRRLDATSCLTLAIADKDGTTLHIEVHGEHGRGRLIGTTTLAVDAAARWRQGLGAVRLQAAVVGLEGVARTPAGEPAAGVPVVVQPSRPYRATTDEQGRFRVWMPAEPPAEEELQLVVANRTWFLRGSERSLPVRFGDRDVAVTVERAARMRFDAPGLPAEAFVWHQCGLHLEDSATGEAHPDPVRLDMHGDHLVLPPGCWNLVFRRGGREVLRIDSVIAEAGIENHDPRLMEFAWQRLGTLVCLDMRDFAGRPTTGYSVVRKQASSRLVRAARASKSYLLLPPEGARIAIKVHGGGEVDLGVVAEDRPRASDGPLWLPRR